MTKEIYVRTPDDPYFVNGVIEFSNEVEEVLTQVKVLLGTVPGDVLCEPAFGVDIERLVFDTARNAASIEKEVNEAISTYIPYSPNISVKAKISFGRADKGYDYGVLDIFVNGTKAIGFLIDKE